MGTLMRKAQGAARALPIDVQETETGYRVSADLPGYPKDHVKVTVHDGTLTIDAERKQEEETKTDNTWRQERFYGKVHRAVKLPDTADESAVEARFDNGVLHVTIGKKAIEDAAPAPRQIEIS